MNDDPFEDARLLLSGAARHIQAFSDRIDNLRKTEWAKPVSLPPQDCQMSIRVDLNVKVPPDLKQIAFDILGNLRSALDNAVHAGSSAITGRDLENGTKFPFGDDEAGLKGDAKRKCRAVPAELLELLLAFQAHKEGNPLLWALNKLRNTKSHRFLVPCVASTSFVGASEPTLGSTRTYEWKADERTLNTSLQLHTGVTLGATAYVFRLEVLIGTGALRSEPALTIFNRMHGEVERIISAIEAETTRLMN